MITAVTTVMLTVTTGIGGHLKAVDDDFARGRRCMLLSRAGTTRIAGWNGLCVGERRHQQLHDQQD